MTALDEAAAQSAREQQQQQERLEAAHAAELGSVQAEAEEARRALELKHESELNRMRTQADEAIDGLVGVAKQEKASALQSLRAQLEGIFAEERTSLEAGSAASLAEARADASRAGGADALAGGAASAGARAG